jgi:hypothetical protein
MLLAVWSPYPCRLLSSSSMHYTLVPPTILWSLPEMKCLSRAFLLLRLFQFCPDSIPEWSFFSLSDFGSQLMFFSKTVRVFTVHHVPQLWDVPQLWVWNSFQYPIPALTWPILVTWSPPLFRVDSFLLLTIDEVRGTENKYMWVSEPKSWNWGIYASWRHWVTG